MVGLFLLCWSNTRFVPITLHNCSLWKGSRSATTTTRWRSLNFYLCFFHHFSNFFTSRKNNRKFVATRFAVFLALVHVLESWDIKAEGVFGLLDTKTGTAANKVPFRKSLQIAESVGQEKMVKYWPLCSFMEGQTPGWSVSFGNQLTGSDKLMIAASSLRCDPHAECPRLNVKHVQIGEPSQERQVSLLSKCSLSRQNSMRLTSRSVAFAVPLSDETWKKEAHCRCASEC